MNWMTMCYIENLANNRCRQIRKQLCNADLDAVVTTGNITIRIHQSEETSQMECHYLHFSKFRSSSNLRSEHKTPSLFITFFILIYEQMKNFKCVDISLFI